MKKEFHHIGFPVPTKQLEEIYLADLKLYVTDASKSEHKIEWLRFEAGTPLPRVLQTTAHAAFTVDDLEEALAGKKVIVKPMSPMAGLRIAFVQEGAAPVEYLEFAK
jgi:hypothetical protein